MTFSPFSPSIRDISMKRGIHGHPVMDNAAGFDRKNAQVRSYYSGFRAVRRRYGELCIMVSPAASRRAGFFPCMPCFCPCICRVIDGCVNFIGAWYRYEPGLSSSTRRLRYACSPAHLDTSERVIFLGAINLPPTPR